MHKNSGNYWKRAVESAFAQYRRRPPDHRDPPTESVDGSVFVQSGSDKRVKLFCVDRIVHIWNIVNTDLSAGEQATEELITIRICWYICLHIGYEDWLRFPQIRQQSREECWSLKPFLSASNFNTYIYVSIEYSFFDF